MNKITTILNIVREANPETKKKIIEAYPCPDCSGEEWEHAILDVDFDWCDNCPVCKRLEAIAMKEIKEKTLYPSHLLVALSKEGSRWTVRNSVNGTWYVQKSSLVGASSSKSGVIGFDGLILTQPLEPQLQSNPELVETLYQLLKE